MTGKSNTIKRDLAWVDDDHTTWTEKFGEFNFVHEIKITTITTATTATEKRTKEK